MLHTVQTIRRDRLNIYRRASEIQPDAAEYAIGYAAALVQADFSLTQRSILRQVVQRNPQNYAARANLATALYEAKTL